MKKVYLSIAIGLVSSGAMAQALQRQKDISVVHAAKPSSDDNQEKVTLWSNDFSSAATWTIQDLAGDGDNWVIGTGVPSGVFPIDPIESTTAANGYALFDSDLLCSGNQNSIVRNTTAIDLTGEPNVSLQFESYYRAFQGTTYVGFSTDATNWTYVEVHTNIDVNDATPNPEVVSLPTSVIGGSSTAYICFRYQGGCDYAWMVDDVQLIRTPDYDLKMTYNRHHTDGYQYSQIPLTQVGATAFEAGVTNNGVNNLTDIELTVNVTGAATTTLTSTPVATSVSGQIDTLSVSYTPSAVGVYNFTQALSLTETDENPANNTGLPNVTIEVTNHIYAVDKGAPYSNYPELEDIFLDATVPYTEIGNSFDVYASQQLYGIDVHLASTTQAGGELYGTLYAYNGAATSAADLWTNTGNETEILVVDGSTALGAIHSLKFSAPVNLTAGTYMISVRETSDGIVLSGSGATTGNTQSWGWIVSPTNGATWTGLSLTPVVRMNFNPALSVEGVSALEGVKVYPNPSTGLINISNDMNVENTIVVTDVTGKQVAAKTASSATTIDLSNVGTGVYIVEIANENGKKVERVVIK